MTSLYRLFDVSGRLLYIGIAGNPGRRFQQHATDKEWWGDVGRVALEHFASREEATSAETRAIRTERPVHNVVHNGLPQAKDDTKTTTRPLTILCSECREPIADKTGYIEVDLSHVHDVQAAYRSWKERHTPRGWEAVDMKSLLELPGHAPWLAWHQDCDPSLDAVTYWFSVERFRTAAHVLDWTAHLMEKRWLKHTDWDDVLRSISVHWRFSRTQRNNVLTGHEVR